VRELPELHSSPPEPLPNSPVPDQSSGVVPPLQSVEPKRNKGGRPPRGEWHQQFQDFPGVDLDNLYYKSECRPLKELKPWHRETSAIMHVHKHTFRKWLDLRDKARKDLYWLGKECIATEESGAGFVEHVHREMCGMFVPKDFDGVYFKGFTLRDVRNAIDRQKREKEMLLLAPRGSYKSTTNKIDCVQWILNCPDIRIFIVTGAANLANKFLQEVKGFFYKPKGSNYTKFQGLFPEFVITGPDGTSLSDLVCPARICRQEGNPTLWVNSIGGVLAGWHCDLFKGDDIVNEDNSNNDDTREKLKHRYDNVSANLPDEWAFRDQLGTRYVAEDWYGERIADMKRYGETNTMKYLKRAAWTVKPGFEHIPIRMLQEHMVDLYFPEKLTFRSLITKCRQNEKQFRCQLLNEPAGSDLAVSFEEEDLKAHLIIETRVPKPIAGHRRIVVCWDTAHSDTLQSDYTAGAVGYFHEDTRSLYVLEVRYGKWKDSDVAKQVVDVHMKWKPMFSELEKFPGYELLAAEIQRHAFQKYGQTIVLSWRDTVNVANAKRNSIKGLASVLDDNRLWFVDGEWIEQTFQQFVRFTGTGKRKDDIPDAISRLQRLIPAQAFDPDQEQNETPEQRKMREAQELRMKFAEQHKDLAYRTMFGVPEAPPVMAVEPERKVDEGPGKIFGGIGLHL
jgi:phage terminase large subunit-like protein